MCTYDCCCYLCISVQQQDVHNHVPDTFQANRGRLLKRMNKRIRKDPTKPVRRVYEKAVDDNSEDSDVASFHNVRSRSKRYRARFMPVIPQEADEVIVPGEWRQTWNGRVFLLHQDNDWGLLIYSTSEMLEVLSTCQCLFVDGTFRTAPLPYEQVMTIHGKHLGFVIPVAFCLLTGKSVGQYRQVFQGLKRAVRHNHQPLRPRRIVTDFERSLMTAVETEFPRARISGCYFHFTQSLWRHVQQLGLASLYRQNTELKKLIRLVMALGFLPVLLVRQNFILLHQRRRTRRLARRHPEVDDWLTYVYQTYINNAAFPIPVWNVYDRSVNSRTNNHVEGECLVVAVLLILWLSQRYCSKTAESIHSLSRPYDSLLSL